jgi:magnesium-transporting ATPase (P-type)
MVNNAELSKVLSKVDEDSLEYRNIFESNLIYLGTFGLEDPLREGIMDDINTMQWGSKEGK